VARYRSFTKKALLFLGFVWFIWFMGFTLRTVFSPILPLIEDEFGVAHARATSILTFIALGYGTSLFFSGAFAGLLGSRKSILLSTAVSGAVFLLIPTVTIFQVLYPLGFVQGMAAGLYLPSMIPLITDYYEEKLWGKAIAVHGSAPSLAILAAPFIALFLLTFFEWRGVFLLLGSAMCLCALAFYTVTSEVETGRTESYFLGTILKRRAFWIMGTVWIFAAGCNLGLYLVIPLYLIKELAVDMENANLILGMSRLGGAILTILAGLFVDRLSLKRSAFVLVLLSGIFTVLSAVKNILLVKVFLFLQATVSPTVFPIILVAVPKLFGKEERGQATGFIVTLGMIGTGVIPYLLGLSGDHLSFRFGIFVLGTATACCSGLLFFLKELE
jgi:MFS family permease